MRLLLKKIITTLEAGEDVAIVAITRSKGSSPRSSGARMLVRVNGSTSGTIGGGSLEGRCIEEANLLLQQSSTYKELDFMLDSKTVASEGMVCGGAITVLIQKIGDSELELFKDLDDQYQKGLRPVLLTILSKTADRNPLLRIACDKTTAEFGPDYLKMIQNNPTRVPILLDTDLKETYFEPLISPGVVHLVGAGHISVATAQIAAFADFEVVVIDDREEFANSTRYPMTKQFCVVDSFANCFDQLSTDDFVVIVTRGHLHDKDVLAQALRTNAGYIGMIGSRRKRDIIYQTLLEEGFTEKDLARVFSPIGLNIGADTPNEIALSIVTELIQVRSAANKG